MPRQGTGFSERFERLSRRVTRAVGRPWAFLAALVIVLGWATSVPLFGFGDTWQLVINTGTTIVTFLMVFLIQQTQNKDGKAVELKLNELVAATITDGSQIVFLATHNGMAIRFDEDNVRSMGRPARGVRGIDLGKNDYVVGMAATPKDRGVGEDGKACACLILSVTEHGYGKRTDVDEYRLQTRGGKGVINVKTTAKNGKVVSIQLVDDTSELVVISQYGKIIRIDTNGVRAAGRSTQGVRLLNLDKEDKVAASVVIPPEEVKDVPENGTLLQ